MAPKAWGRGRPRRGRGPFTRWFSRWGWGGGLRGLAPSDRAWALVLWALNLLLGAGYGLATPAYEASDELWHMPFVLALSDGQGLPVQRPGTAQPWRQEGSQPPLYYALAAAASGRVDTSDRSEVLQRNPHTDMGRLTSDGNHNMAVHRPGESLLDGGLLLAVALARAVSVLLASLTVPLTFLVARATLPERPWAAVGAAALVAFNPMFLFIQGSVNNDNLVVPLATLALYLLVRYVRQGLSARRLVLLGALVGLAALAKVSGLGLAVLAGLAVLYRRRPREGLLLAAPALLAAGWWYLRNLRLYGELLGLETMVSVAGARHPPPTLLQLTREWWGAFMAYWGFFGGMNVAAPPAFYHFFLGLTVAALAGFVWWLLRRRRIEPALALLVVWAGLNLGGLVRWTMSTIASQGRLLFPSLGALSLFMALGLLHGPLRLRKAVLAGLTAALFLVAAWVPAGVIRPAYALPQFLPAEAVPAGRPVELGGRVRLLAWEIPTSDVRAGEAVPVKLYWQAIAPMTQNYSVFIHLVDENGIIVGQRDVYPGPGTYPTSRWQPGTIFADAYHVPVPETANVPADLAVLAGLYDLETGLRLSAGDADHVRLGTVRAVPARESPYPNPMRAVLGERVALVGYRLEPTAATAGETLTLTLYWQALRTMHYDYTVFTHVLGPTQSIWGQEDRRAPTSRWTPGQIYEEVYHLTLSLDTPPDVYEVEVGLYRADDFSRLELVGPHGQVQDDRILLGRVRVR